MEGYLPPSVRSVVLTPPEPPRPYLTSTGPDVRGTGASGAGTSLRTEGSVG